MRSLHRFRQAARTASAFLALLPCVAAHAEQAYAPQAYATRFPPPVTEWLEHARQDCPAGFAAQNPIQTVDLTGDGRPGYIADPHRLTCAGEPHLFIGDGPASIELFVTLPSGEVVNTGGVVAFGYRVIPSPQGTPPTLSFQTQGSGGLPGNVDDYRWDGSNFTVLNRSAMEAPPASYAPPGAAYAPQQPAYASAPPGYSAPPGQAYAPQSPADGPPQPGYGPDAPAYPPPAYGPPPRDR